MKTKNLMIGGLMIAATCIGSAFAGPDTDKIKQICLDKEAKTASVIWVEKDKACIPHSPCDKDNLKKYGAYCYNGFEHTNLASRTLGNAVVQKYMSVKKNTTCSTITKINTYIAELPGYDDYINCKTPDGGFMQFQFDDLSETIDSTSGAGLDKAYCFLNGIDATPNPDNVSEKCIENLSREKVEAYFNIKFTDRDKL